MMKNSKLSKLLVAGVSVAMLASALAPMAFAEEEGSAETILNPAGTIYFFIPKDAGKFDEGKGVEQNYNSHTYKYEKVEVPFTEADKEKAFSELIPAYSMNGFATDNFLFVNNYNADDFNTTGIVKYDGAAAGAGAHDYKISATDTLQTVLDNSANPNPNPNPDVFIDCTYSKYVTVNYTNTDLDRKVFKWTSKGSFDTNPSKTVADFDYIANTKFAADAKVTLPEVTLINGSHATIAGYTVTIADNDVTSDDVNLYTDDNLFTGKELDLGSISKYFDLKGPAQEAAKITITPVLDSAYSVKLKLDYNNAVKYQKNGKTYTIAAGDLMGATPDDVDLLTTYDGDAASSVYSSETINLPAVAPKTAKGVVFSHWAVEKVENPGDITANVKMSDGSKAKNYGFVNNTFSAKDFKENTLGTTPADATVTLVPVFAIGEPTDPVVVYGEYKTPNDTPVKSVDGKATAYTGTIGDELKFTSGLWYNTKDDTFAYYLPKNSAGKWEIDTTVNGLVDGIVFDKGVQDTEAYGLYKVSDSDPFFYLVSDGVYQADYTGMWEDEDGSVYKLEDGCTNTTFTGVYDRGDWALSVKDSKVQKDETGFVLYGDTQYWFINGICNMKETEAVRQHTNGRFYYTVGAKIDFTFNGTVNGHTFVNGEAAE